ncbi:MAG: hypothetical protein QM504_01050 [Pseudomonadota bacterium]
MKVYFWLIDLTHHIGRFISSIGVLYSEAVNNSSYFESDYEGSDDFDDGYYFNPATGLPMMGCFDVGGNVYGAGDSYIDSYDMFSEDSFDLCSDTDDMFSDDSVDTSSMFDEW